jgi:hypothetical protein
MSNDSPYKFVSLGEVLTWVTSSTIRDGVRVPLTSWQFTYINSETERNSWCFGTDEIDAYKDALRRIANMEKKYFKRQEAKREKRPATDHEVQS